jgi:hypothetical protein
LQALAPDGHAVAHRRAVIADVVEILGHGIDMDVAGRSPSRWATRVGMKRGCRPQGLRPARSWRVTAASNSKLTASCAAAAPASGAENSAAEVMMKWRRVSMGSGSSR